MQGETIYENAIKDVESLAKVVDAEEGDATQLEGPQYVATDVWKQKPARTFRAEYFASERASRQTLSEDGDDLQKRFPKLWKKFGD